MKYGMVFAVLLLLAGSATISRAQFNEEDLAATISFDSGYPAEGYEDYARSLAKTLALLSPDQVFKVFKGKGPIRKAEVHVANEARDSAESDKKVEKLSNGNK